ncbi:TerC family protein [Rhodocyclus tenuis]|uniref:TerC/Alx family metal homeostasis membrane protein n=2 Tax=Rhodocyclus TaxID=1064 RepID=A0A6L5JUY4_RHOTE|nr:TerC family protein [Rhodocyclus gracilis]MQY51197.1 TerC/Alx family metal homeostasis membrane protein [Rhodocyclus gracilis]MRD71917.1 TerC/Alx family metal homeostasis membrane protein [Rhodocyclus gracilis]NJA88906.1 TerC family protein [Rhodocyclus gracilis]
MDGIANVWMWAGFAAFVVIAIAIDLVSLDRRGAHVVGVREALSWSALWVGLALAFAGLLWLWLDYSSGRELATLKTTEFLTGYLIEKSLSVDNIFVFLMLFTAFAVPPPQQKRALILGVIGAVLLRAVMILIGAWLVARFHWLLYLFGAFLLLTGGKMLFAAEHEPDLEKNPVLRWMRRHLAITPAFHGDRLWLREGGLRQYTPLFVVVMLIAVTDVIFAVDSIPAIFAITTDPFIVMTSNLFAVLGLRALYFLLADLAGRFHLLKYGLAFVLVFIGSKMLIVEWVKIPVFAALAVVAIIIAIAVVASLLRPPAEGQSKE